MTDYQPAFLLGRLSSGAEHGQGTRWHALPKAGGMQALCGAKPGRRSAGWGPHNPAEATGQAITCPRCLQRLERLQAQEHTP